MAEERKKFFITAAFPYPNSPQHIGHARTYSTADTYARYKKLLGYDVLFPMAFHVTGTPILGMAERIKENDKEIIEVLTKIYGIEEKQLKELSDPYKLVMYFSEEIEKGMKEMAFYIDWSRKFYTFDEHFKKFIQWQFKKLAKKGYLIKGEHYVAWSKKLNSAVGAHDTKGDIDPVIEEVTIIKFKFDDGFLLVTTYRPETVFGVTNIWVNKNATYVKVKNKNNNEVYYLSKDALENFEEQFDVEKLQEIDGNMFIDKMAFDFDNNAFPIYHADFVKSYQGTGFVMSVPAHAPYDYVALRDINKLKVKKIISVKGSENELLVEKIVEELNIKNQLDDKLEEATKKLYLLENEKGFMEVFKKGMSVKEAKQEVKKWLIEKNFAFPYYIIANGPILTRANDMVVVKRVKDQWFIDYGNKEWKELSLKCLEKMKILPKEIKQEIKNTIMWLGKKACTRSKGFGTNFPFDENQVIESLSDSTIYPAFYTIADKIKAFKPDQLTEEFFDYIFLGIGKPINKEHEELRKQFLYWYPVDSRHSGPDLIRNHLTFYIMNHVAIFPEDLWPRQIVVNGFVLMEGKKMSKSLGNILPLRKVIKEHGADVIRFAVVSNSDLMQATNFNKELVEGIKVKLSYFEEVIKSAEKSGNGIAEKWIRASLAKKIINIKNYLEEVNLREIAKELFYDFYHDLRFYEAIKNGKFEIKDVMLYWLTAISPFFPIFSEKFEKKEKIDFDYYKDFDTTLIASMEVVRNLHSEITEYLQKAKIQKEDIDIIKVIVPAKWKYELYKKIKEKKKLNLVISEMQEHKEEIEKIAKRLGNKLYALPNLDIPERELFIECLNITKNLFPANVIIEEEEQSKEEKANLSLPLKVVFIINKKQN